MITISNTTLEWFVQTIKTAETLTETIGILLVANIQGKTKPIDDYEGNSIITEFLKNDELDELIEGFEKSNIYCEVVIDEQGFLKWLEQSSSTFPRKCILVYNLAQNGTGAARLSLIPGLCRLNNLLLIDSDAYAVSIARHKFHCLMILQQLGLPVARSWWFTSEGWIPEPPPIGLKLIVKPTYESASIGIHKDSIFTMHSTINDQLLHSLNTFRQPLTVQEFICGFEVEVPIFEANGPQAVKAVGIEVNGKRNLGDFFLIYDTIANNQYTFYDFDEERPVVSDEIIRIAKNVFKFLCLNGVSRADFRVRPDGVPLLIEIACKPHLTKHSSFAYTINSIGAKHTDLLKFLVGSAATRYKIKS
jgi:D-alanine-D-alanine ligase